MITNPALLLLDEPTSQLDPITAMNFLETLARVNRDFGITVILAEHRLEEVFSMADTVLAMDSGRLIACDTPKAVCEKLRESRLFPGFPTAARLWKALGEPGEPPVNVREGKTLMHSVFGETKLPFSPPEKEASAAPDLLTAKGLWFRFTKDGPDVLRDLNITLKQGEIFSILGPNGVGKTTLLQILAGLRKPYHGKVKFNEKPLSAYLRGSLYKNGVALLPQDPKTVFIKDTVLGDLTDILVTLGHKKEEAVSLAGEAAEKMGVTHLLEQNPYDLSGGERQKCAMCKLLLTRPSLLLLDEPTKGLDAFSKRLFASLLKDLAAGGKTVLMVTHDIEFAAAVSDTAALLFDGELLAAGTPHAFFRGNTFYTTAAARMAREHVPGAISVEEIASAADGSVEF